MCLLLRVVVQAIALLLGRSPAKEGPQQLHVSSLTRPSRRASRARPRTSMKVTEARAEWRGEKRRVRPVPGDVGYAIARLQLR